MSQVPQASLNSLATIIKRLEAATSRLEDLATVSAAPTTQQPSTSSSVPPALAPQPSLATAPVNETPVTVKAFEDNVIKGTLQPFIEFNKAFAGSIVLEQVMILQKLFSHVQTILLMATKCRKPDERDFIEILTPFQTGIEAISRYKNQRRTEWDNHISMIAESVQAVAWVTVEPKPSAFIKEMVESAQFYGNRVLKEWRVKEPKHEDWVKQYINVLESMRKYVIEYHTNGLVWNPKGVLFSEYKALNDGAAAAGGAPPPPPPPPPPPAGTPAPTASGSGGVAAVFAELNKGEEVTKGLRKVDKSEMTHKNPALRASSVVPSTPVSTAKKPVRPVKPAALAGKKPAKLALEGNKWAVEYYENDNNIIISEAEINHTVNLYGCKNVTVQVKGKVNGVTIVNCTKTSVLIDSVISSVSVTNSPSFQIQITGTCPTIQLDSTDSGVVYLSSKCLDAEITTAKCSAININIPTEAEEGVFEEKPVPEMFKTVVKDGKLVTTIVEHAG